MSKVRDAFNDRSLMSASHVHTSYIQHFLSIYTKPLVHAAAYWDVTECYKSCPSRMKQRKWLIRRRRLAVTWSLLTGAAPEFTLKITRLNDTGYEAVK